MDKRPVTKSVPKLATESGRSERWAGLSNALNDVPMRAKGSTLVRLLKLL
jgi:hypothetical protein